MMKMRNGSERKITIPDYWKVTFGPTIPFERKAGAHHGSETWALRLYNGDKLKAIFTDVINFRDMSIEIREKRIQTKRHFVERAAQFGGKSATMEARVETWCDPDEPDEANTADQNFLQISKFEQDGDIEF